MRKYAPINSQVRRFCPDGRPTGSNSVPERRAKIPPEFIIWKPRIPSLYAEGLGRAEITSFSLALNRFVPASCPAPSSAYPTISRLLRVVVLYIGALFG